MLSTRALPTFDGVALAVEKTPPWTFERFGLARAEWSGESDSGLSEDEDEWDSSSDSEGSTGSSFESFKDEGEADGWEVVGEGAIEDAEENHPEDDADEDNYERVSSLLSDELIAWHRDSVAPIANKRGGRRSAVTLATSSPLPP